MRKLRALVSLTILLIGWGYSPTPDASAGMMNRCGLVLIGSFGGGLATWILSSTLVTGNEPAWNAHAVEERIHHDYRNNWHSLLSNEQLRSDLRDLLIRKDYDTYLEYSNPNRQHLTRAEFDSIAEHMAPFRKNWWKTPEFRVVTTLRERPMELANFDLVADEIPEGETRTIDSFSREQLLFRFGGEPEGAGQIRITVNVLEKYYVSAYGYRRFQIDRIELGDVP